jgi:hypothetical protein
MNEYIKVYFAPTEVNLSLDHVGHIFLRHQNERIKDLVEKIKEKKFKIINTDMPFTDVCNFKDCFLASSNSEKRVKVFLKANVPIKRVKMLDGKEIEPFGITTNKINRIYVTDVLNNRVIMTNNQFQYMASIDILQPYDICFDKFLYICSDENKITKCNADFSNAIIFDVYEVPWQIKVKDEKAVVRFSDEIRIYDALTFSNHFKTINQGGDICIIDEYFISSRKEAFSIYDFNANIIEYIPEPFYAITDNNYHGLDICNGKLVLTTPLNKMISIDLS